MPEFDYKAEDIQGTDARAIESIDDELDRIYNNFELAIPKPDDSSHGDVLYWDDDEEEWAATGALDAGELAGRGSDSGSGPIEPITLGTGLSLSGTTLSASGGAWDTTLTKVVDDSVTNSATEVSDSELKFTTAAGGVYDVEVVLLYSANSNGADIRARFNVDSGTMYASFLAIHNGTTNSPASTAIGANDAASTGVVQAGTDQASSDAKIHALVIRGTFRASATAVFALQFAQNVATVGSTTKTRIGSIMRYKRLV